jgi:hypothetical protein
MLVAMVANHVRNGFFIFRPGEGYEYVLLITLVCCAIGALGAGNWSLDHAAGLHMSGWAGLAIAAAAGAGGATLLLATSWRPARSSPSSRLASAVLSVRSCQCGLVRQLGGEDDGEHGHSDGQAHRNRLLFRSGHTAGRVSIPHAGAVSSGASRGVTPASVLSAAWPVRSCLRAVRHRTRSWSR